MSKTKFTFDNGCILVVGDFDLASIFPEGIPSLKQVSQLAILQIENGKIENSIVFGEVTRGSQKEVYFENDATIVLPSNICVNDYKEALTILIKD